MCRASFFVVTSVLMCLFFFSSRRRHTRFKCDWSSDVCSSDLQIVFGDPLETIWKNCVFGLCGVNIFHRRSFSTVVTSTEAQRRQWLDGGKAMIDSVFP